MVGRPVRAARSRAIWRVALVPPGAPPETCMTPVPSSPSTSAERQTFRVGAGAGGIAAAQRGGAEAKRAGVHAVAHQPLHGGEFVGVASARSEAASPIT